MCGTCQSCENCKHFWADYSVDAYDCGKVDAMTEEEFENEFIDGDGTHCRYYEELIEEDYHL